MDMTGARRVRIDQSTKEELARHNASLEDRIRERTAELNAANAGLRELSALLMQARDEERRRIARELHDSVGQLVIAIKINNAAIAKESAALSQAAVRALHENESMLQELHQGIRTISHLLHPPLLDEVGLPVALQWYVEEFSKRSNIQMTLECCEVADRAISDVETAIFRIVQECLVNVHRHSASSTATVKFHVQDGNAHLEVRDQGVGIPPNRRQDINSHGRVGVGLRGIRERVAQLGGEIKIESSQKGTTICVMLPWTPLASSSASA